MLAQYKQNCEKQLQHDSEHEKIAFEELLERGAITAAEYRRMLASLPEQQERAEATDGALARRTQQHVPPTVRVARLDLGDPRGHAEVVTNQATDVSPCKRSDASPRG